MQLENHITFKEWAVVCAALASGRQTIILRKGGIDEGRAGFRVQHHQFWLLPTRFHQNPAQLTPDAQPLWAQLQQNPPPPGKFLVNVYAVVHTVFEVHDLAMLSQLAGQHILSAEIIEQRFHYRHPGLFVLAVRAYRLPTALEVADSPYIAGCKSWVELPEPLSTAGAVPVLADESFAQRMQHLQSLLQEPR